jgi:SMC interacting uncharacterized protein involved in chromosome segregation
MTNQQKADAYRNAIVQLEQQKFGKETEIKLLDAQIAQLEHELMAVDDPSLMVPGP